MSLQNKIGVMVDSFRLPIKDGLKKAKEVGADGVQIYAVKGEMDPENLSSSNRSELRKYIEDLGLEVSALCGDLGGHGFQDKSENEWKIEKSKRILDLAMDLGTNIVTTHIGMVPDTMDEIYEEMHKACAELCTYASSMNAYFAIETGPETAQHLKSFLDTLPSNGLSVNFDPANMVMVTSDDPVQGVHTLKDYIVHTHVKDGVQYKKVDPREIYGSPGYERKDIGVRGKIFSESPLGEGSVDFNAYFKALQDIGYTGYLTIERKVGTQPEVDIRRAVEFIERWR